MFRHQGAARTFKHNVGIATILSFVAGLVNVAGFIAVQKLTTNVTGHFAFFMGEVYEMHFNTALVYLLYVLFFLLGAFTSSIVVEYMAKRNNKLIYVIPVLVESLILLMVAVSGTWLLVVNADIIAFSLLFAMGLQNALVTKISGSVVRTTHLTGLFTDLGIELSQLFFYNKADQRSRLLESIGLRMAIITSFFVGGVLGAVLYKQIGLLVLIGAAAILFVGVLVDHWSLIRAAQRKYSA